MKRYEEALRDFTQAIVLDPNAPKSSAQRGMTYLLMGKNEEALQDFNHAFILNSDSSWRFYRRSLAYRLMGDILNAHRDLDQALRIASEIFKREPDDWENILSLALCHLARSNFEQSKKLFHEMLKAKVYPSLLKSAKIDLDEFILLFPDNKDAKEIRALLD